jgi:hypothetical protein
MTDKNAKMDLRARSVDKVDLPDGQYDANWGGYSLTIDEKVTVMTAVGIRTMNFPCTVDIINGIAYINE